MNPSQLGRFQILRELGQGAMGKVYLAYDSKIHRQVAIKTVSILDSIPPEEIQETRDRFLREAQAAGKLIHPHIVTVFDVGEDQGTSFIAMEFVEGETLDLYTRPGCLLPLERVLKIVSQACRALDYAHSQHIVHRDIKPANLILMPGDQLKITDFGLAKQPSANLTQQGPLMGTPFYMSPEQISGKPVDGRSDLFSLGIVLYQLLTGERPFSGESVSTILYRILYEKPPAPKIINEKLPIHFNTVLDRALAKDPAERYQTGEEFRESLERYKSTYIDSPVAAPPGTETKKTPPRQVARVPKPAPRPSPRPRPVARIPLFAGHPVKIGILVVSALMAVLLFPTSFGKEPIPGTKMAGIGFPTVPGPGVETGPPGKPGMFRVWVTTDPPGADLFLDGEELNQDSFLLSLGDDTEHLLLARSECLKSEMAIRVADRPEAVELKLVPEIFTFEVISEPAGARLQIDGAKAGQQTPTSVELDRCRTHTISLSREGYYPWEKTFQAQTPREEFRDQLAQAVLRKIPNGYLRIPSPEGYSVEVFEGDRRIGTSGERITLPSGNYRIVLKNQRHFVEKEIRVDVPGNRLVEPNVLLPKLGYLTILALPSNCKIYVGGKYLDIPPVMDYPIAAGVYVIRGEYLPTGEIQEETITVEPGRLHRITFRFES